MLTSEFRATAVPRGRLILLSLWQRGSGKPYLGCNLLWLETKKELCAPEMAIRGRKVKDH